MEKIVNLKNEYIDNVSDEFNKSLVEVEKELSKELNKLIGSYYGKKLSLPEKAKLLNEIESKLNKLILSKDYKSAVSDYLVSFDEINNLQKQLHKQVNGISLKKIPLNDYKNAQISIVKNNLLESGASAKFAEPIKEILTRNVLIGTSIEDARQLLEEFVLGDDSQGVLQRYAGQVANDTIRQYEGALNTAIKEEYGMTKWGYLGSIIKTSRGQCRAWVEREVLTDEELEVELPIAVSGGVIDGYTCSGMIDPTTLDNFGSNRGGYNCKHTAIPVY